jgi:hypothetical protein
LKAAATPGTAVGVVRAEDEPFCGFEALQNRHFIIEINSGK